MSRMEELLEVRKKTLSHSDKLIDVCHNCTKRRPYTMDRQNPVCNDCPIQKEIYKVRAVLDGTLSEMRAIRK